MSAQSTPLTSSLVSHLTGIKPEHAHIAMLRLNRKPGHTSWCEQVLANVVEEKTPGSFFAINIEVMRWFPGIHACYDYDEQMLALAFAAEIIRTGDF